MASIIKRGDKYRAQLYVKGIRYTATFRTKREAQIWSAAKETELLAHQATPVADRHTLRDTFIRYRDEVTPKKRGARWETIRINKFMNDTRLPLDHPLSQLTTPRLAEWRDAALRTLSPGSVLREIAVLSAILETARIEWQWISKNPLAPLRKPPQPDHRDVVITPDQIHALLKVMGYSPTRPIRTVAQATAVCFLVALRTGMRAGELVGLTWDRVKDDHCVLPVTKSKPRSVPYTAKTLRLLDKMRDYDPEKVFGIPDTENLSANFRRFRKKAGIEGITFHDARHTAATRLAKRVDVLTLCKIFGWGNPRFAMIYYNPSVSDMARMLA